VLWFGSGKNWDAGPSESNHKENVKRKAELTNLCKETLDDQVTSRFVESLVIEHAKGIINGKEDNISADVPIPSSTGKSTGSKVKVTISCSTNHLSHYNSIAASWDGRPAMKFSPDCTSPLPPEDALAYLLQLVRNAHLSIPAADTRPPCTNPIIIRCFTDYHTYHGDDVGCGKSQIYRAHPAFHGQLPWNNWVYVKYCISDGNGNQDFQDHLSKNYFIY
jgi:hypothetical protein